MFWRSVFGATMLAAGAQAGIVSLVAEGMKRGGPAFEQRMREIAQAEIQARGGLVDIRQSTMLNSSTGMTGATPGVSLNADGTINMAAWDEAVTTACTNSLNQLSASSNPSGTCVCYNIMSLNNSTGAFEADLRLYQLSGATGEFAGIAPQNVMVGLSYSGASVSPVANATAASMASAAAKRSNSLKLLQGYLFVGQIDSAKMPSAAEVATIPGMAKLEALVLPTVTLSAVNSAGNTVSTNVSTNEAAFVTGVFSNAVVMSNATMAQLAVDAVVAELANGTVAFILPGVHLILAPIGLIVTSIWLAIFLAAWGWGTFERIGYADAYKRRAQVAKKGSVSRI